MSATTTRRGRAVLTQARHLHAVPPPPTPTDPDDTVSLWADARIAYYANEYPEYGTPAWQALGPDDPRRVAAALDYAEQWRKYGDPVVDWFRDVHCARTPLASRKTRAELDQAWQDVVERAEQDWTRRRAALAARCGIEAT